MKNEQSSCWSKAFWVRLGCILTKPNAKSRRKLSKFLLKSWEQFGQVDNLESIANVKHWLSINWLVSLEQVQACRPHAVYSHLSIFFFLVRLWNGSPDRLHCNFYFIRNLQFHIFPNGITWIIYISGNNLSINHWLTRAHRKDRDESKSCFIIRSSFLKILTFIGLKSEAV